MSESPELIAARKRLAEVIREINALENPEEPGLVTDWVVVGAVYLPERDPEQGDCTRYIRYPSPNVTWHTMLGLLNMSVLTLEDDIRADQREEGS